MSNFEIAAQLVVGGEPHSVTQMCRSLVCAPPKFFSEIFKVFKEVKIFLSFFLKISKMIFGCTHTRFSAHLGDWG